MKTLVTPDYLIFEITAEDVSGNTTCFIMAFKTLNKNSKEKIKKNSYWIITTLIKISYKT